MHINPSFPALLKSSLAMMRSIEKVASLIQDNRQVVLTENERIEILFSPALLTISEEEVSLIAAVLPEILQVMQIIESAGKTV